MKPCPPPPQETSQPSQGADGAKERILCWKRRELVEPLGAPRHPGCSGLCGSCWHLPGNGLGGIRRLLAWPAGPLGVGMHQREGGRGREGESGGHCSLLWMEKVVPVSLWLAKVELAQRIWPGPETKRLASLTLSSILPQEAVWPRRDGAQRLFLQEAQRPGCAW